MEEQYFNTLRNNLCSTDQRIQRGKMMSSEAIIYNNKVFAFFSRQRKMVFKLGKDFREEQAEFEIKRFNPFKNRSPMNGWYEVSYTECIHWELLTAQALELIKNEP